MYKNNTTKRLIICTFSLLWLQGCVPSGGKCFTGAARSGYFCHQGYNFGKNRTHAYKQGVKHGCRTANGHFIKNYALSGSSPEYIKGWDRGRATCRLILPKEAEAGTMRTQYQQSIDERNYYGN